MGDTVAAQLVGHEQHGFLSLTLQQSAKESPRCLRVPTGLYEDVYQVTVLIHHAPEILALTVDSLRRIRPDTTCPRDDLGDVLGDGRTRRRT